MSDINVIKSGELMVAGVEGQTRAGEEFVDAYVTAELVVIDAGRIVLPVDAVPALILAAQTAGLFVQIEEGI